MGQSQLMGTKQRDVSDKDVFRPMPNITLRQNPLGRGTRPKSLSPNFWSVLFSLNAFTISFRSSWSTACRITRQHSLSSNGMGKNINCHCHTLHTGSGCHPHSYGTVHKKHDGNSVCRSALFVVIAPLTVNIIDYLLVFNQYMLTENWKPLSVDIFTPVLHSNHKTLNWRTLWDVALLRCCYAAICGVHTCEDATIRSCLKRL